MRLGIAPPGYRRPVEQPITAPDNFGDQESLSPDFEDAPLGFVPESSRYEEGGPESVPISELSRPFSGYMRIEIMCLWILVYFLLFLVPPAQAPPHESRETS